MSSAAAVHNRTVACNSRTYDISDQPIDNAGRLDQNSVTTPARTPAAGNTSVPIFPAGNDPGSDPDEAAVLSAFVRLETRPSIRDGSGVVPTTR
ncbi:hypothetical protein GDN83_21560 [Gordonia jinghuaiqii]|uniref:Uncharacterized protein n=1 Tax=Gordonia jinghuaiqii TaxID=2758710 RepID=A0A7D7LX75_9ACTN|nr:hypothetical protein [Gordonia jinghuaiqii]MCR5980293.1 hypothetical protein [Gordonia jinghuaiqii]QMT01958.1 hypothetical protein H1R19_01830 [Gordonia jinghuaiqii]